MQKKSDLLFSYVLETTPESAGKLLNYEGRIIRQYGNAIILSSSTKISNFTIVWFRKKKNKCCRDIPVILNNNKTSYLNILTRESTDNEYYSLDKTGHFLR